MKRAFLRYYLVPSIALALAANTTAVFAQRPFPATLTAGSRVRVAIADTVLQSPLGFSGQLIYGTVSARTDDTLYLTIPNTTGSLAVPRARMLSLAISKGMPTRGRSVAVYGARYAVLGAAMFYLLHGAGRNDGALGSRGAATAAGGGVGLALGVFLGARAPVEQWRNVRLWPGRHVR